MTTLVLASGNAGKIAELQSMLQPKGFNVLGQKSLDIPDIPETGLSFIENALIKARNACQYSGLPSIADDSGLAVDYLKGAPGIYSARYAGESATDQSNNAKLLQALEGVEAVQRSARYHCALVYMQHAEDPCPIISQASWEGRILTEAQGNGGFGYDPLFYIESLNKSAAQLPKAQKNAISHRAKALQQLLKQL